MKPTVGRIVHFIAEDRQHLAAIITAVAPGDRVTLHVMQPSSIRPVAIVHNAEYSEAPVLETWHWPEREG